MAVTFERNVDLIELDDHTGPGRLVGAKNDNVVGTVLGSDGVKSRVVWASEPMTHDERIARGVQDQLRRVFARFTNEPTSSSLNDRIERDLRACLEPMKTRSTVGLYDITMVVDPTKTATFDVKFCLGGSLTVRTFRCVLHGG